MKLKPGKTNFLKLFLTIFAVFVSWHAHAHNIKCGAVLKPDRHYVLKKDLKCNTSPVLTLQSNTILDLNQHTISAKKRAEIEICILMQNDTFLGNGATLVNGFLEGCNKGIVLSGEGGHAVKHIDFTHSEWKNDGDLPLGFLIESNQNLLYHNTLSLRGLNNFCIEIDGSHNRLIGNQITDCGDGIILKEGADHNLLYYNSVFNIVEYAFLIRGKRNKLFKNEALRNGPADPHISGIGFMISGFENDLYRNTASSNTGVGYEVSSDRNTLYKNQADLNHQGILVSGTQNRLVRNAAFDNRSDLSDSNTDCDNNLWRNNKFETGSPECVQ